MILFKNRRDEYIAAKITFEGCWIEIKELTSHLTPRTYKYSIIHIPIKKLYGFMMNWTKMTFMAKMDHEKIQSRKTPL